MTENGGSGELREHWRVFLTKNPDARLIVEGAMTRMGHNEDEVLFSLMDAWAAQNLTEEHQRELYEAVCRRSVN